MLRSIFLDLDETLLDFSQAEAVALSRTLRCFEIEPSDHIIQRYHVLNISAGKQVLRTIIVKKGDN